MKGICKYDIVRDFAALHDLKYDMAKMYVDSIVSIIIENLIENGKVHLQYLGTFERKKVEEKEIYSFITKKLETSPEHYSVRFRPSESLRKDLY